MMKRIISVFVILTVICFVLAGHICKICIFTENITNLTEATYDSFLKNDWEKINVNLNEIKKMWDENKKWLSITISTKQIEEAEISLNQSIEYAKLNSKDCFIGELKMFSTCIEHLPKQEGLSVYELL